MKKALLWRGIAVLSCAALFFQTGYTGIVATGSALGSIIARLMQRERPPFSDPNRIIDPIF